MNNQNTKKIRLSFVSLLLAIAFFVRPISAIANPEGGVVSAGQANIITAATTVDIHQQTNKVVIDWRGFDIAPNERTEFHQPSASAIALNRVNSNSASSINGTLKANGNVIIVNQNGVLFGRQAVVDVNGLVASSADTDNGRFMNESTVTLDKAGSVDAAVSNEGSITAKESGLVGFVAPRVENSGVITARLGRVHLAGGEKATVDFYGDGLLEVAVGNDVQHQLVKNTGTINADGGTIALTAAAGRKLLSSSIEVDGQLNAQTVSEHAGKIIISAHGKNAVAENVAANKNNGTSNTASNISVGGALHAEGKNTGEKGGKISITGDAISLKNTAKISSKGAAGGGVIHIGGEYLGLGKTPTARTTFIESGAVIDASATVQGHGGEVIVFADGDTIFNGLIYASGAGILGNGGFVETSGKARLHIGGAVEAKASGGGAAGQWLLDPADITITAATDANITGATPFTATATASQLSAATIVAALDAGTNVTVQTNNNAFAGNGDIFVNSTINSTGVGSLTISAFRNILVNAAISLNGGALTLRSDNTGAGSGAVSTAAAISTNGGAITIGGGSGAITAATYNANGSVLAAATGYATGNAAMSQGVTIGGAMNAGNNGNILINGQGAIGTASSVGVDQSANITTNGTGTISISGINRGTAANTNQANGVTLRNTVSAANGTVQINGQGGGGSNTTSNAGILVASTGGLVRTTGTGAITLSGVGGTSSGGKNFGILLNNASSVSPTGGGAVLIYGQGGNAGANNSGVGINDGGTGSIVAGTSAVTINGTGGASSGGSNYGVWFNGTGAGVGALTTSGAVTINGTGGGAGASSTNHGIYVNGTGATIAKTGGGAFTITGTGGAGTGGSNHGINSTIGDGITSAANATLNATAGAGAGSAGIVSTIANGIRTTGAATLTLLSNTFNISAASAVNSALTLTVAPLTAVTLGLGTGTGVATINNTSLANIVAPSGYIFGSATTSDITVNTTAAFTSRALTFISAGNITLTNAFDNLASLTTTAPTGTTTFNGIMGGTTAIGAYSGTGRDLAINANLRSSSNITAAFTRNITIGAAATVTPGSASGLSLQAAGGSTAGTGNLTINGILNLGTGSLTLLSGINGTRPSWTITAANLLLQGATINTSSISGFLDLTINRNFTGANGSFNLSAFRDLTLAAGNTLQTWASGGIDLRATNGVTTGTGNLNLLGNLIVGTNPITLVSGINGTRPDYTITTTNLVPQSTFGNITINGFNDVTVNRDITSTGSISFTSFRDLTLNAANTLTTGAAGALTLQAANAVTTGTGNLNVNGNVSVGTGNVNFRSGINGTRPSYTMTTTNFAPQTSFGNIDIRGFLDIFINRNITNTGSITIVSFRDLNLNAANTLTTGAAGALTLEAANNMIAGTGNLNLAGNLSVGTGGLNLRSGANGTRPSYTMTTTNLVLQGATLGTVDIRGFLDTFVNRDLPSSGNVVINSFRDLTLNAANTVTSGAAAGLTMVAANSNSGGTGRLTINGTLSNGTGGLNLLSGTNGTRPTYTATTTNLIRQGATFGAVGITGYANFIVDRVLNSTGLVSFSNNTRITLQNDITSTASNVTFTTSPAVVAEGFSPTISTGNANITFSSSTIADTAGGATEGLTLNAGTGAISSNSTIDGVALNASGGSLALTNVLGGTRALGNSVLTSTTSSQFTLPTITALSLNASTTAAASQMNIGGPIVTTGASGLSLASAGSIAKTGAGNLSTINAPLSLMAATNLFFSSAGANLNSGGGVITLNGPAGIINSQSLTVNSANGTLNMNGPVIIGAPLLLNLGTGTANFSSTINALQNIGATVQALVVAGGGGGGSNGGGGGGAGGVQYNAILGVTSGTLINVTVGAGGAAATGLLTGTTGSNSVFSTITSLGGGGGASRGGGGAGLSGGSGGGGGGVGATNVAGATAGTGTAGQGNNGSNGTPSDLGVNAAGGGGGGAGGLGTAGASAVGGNGGAGVSNSITGVAVNYGGGGAGGVTVNGAGGTGGLGGGGTGGNPGLAATNGLANTGGGGGGGGTGGAGGSGVVIVRYTGSTTDAIVVGGTATTVGADTVWTFNSSGSFTPISGCNGGCNLTINAGNVNLGGTIGGITPLGTVILNSTNAFTLPSLTASSLAVTGATNLNGDIFTTSNGPVTFNSLVTVTGNSSIDTGSGTVTFASTVDGANDLTVDAGTVSFGAAVGAATPLANLAITTTNALNISQNISAASILARTTGATSDITIDATRALTASGAGDAITLASGRNFINNSGLGLATMNLTGAGRYLIYSVQPSSDTTGGLVRDFRRFSCSIASVGSCLFNATINNTVTIPAAGNGFIYSSTPGTLTLAISTIANVIYGNSVNLTGLATDATTLGQYLNASDFANDVITGSINGSTTYVAGPIGGGIGTYNINYASGALFSELGYNINYTNNPTAFTVVPRTVTVGLTGVVSRVYDGALAATLAAGNYSIGNVFAGDVLGISNTSGTYDTRHVGTGKTVTVTGLVLTGAPIANYVLASTTAAGGVGTITPRALAIGATGINRIYNALLGASVTLNDDRVAGDVLTTGFTSANFATKDVDTGKTVTVTGLTLGGADAGNYSFNVGTTTTADITPRALTIGAVGINRIYNGLLGASVTLNDDRALGDVLTTGYGAANFSTKDAGTAKTVSVTGLTLGGADAGNYSFNVGTTTTADITPRALTIGAVGINRIYNGLTSGTVTLNDDRVAGDVLTTGFGTATFADRNVGTGIGVAVTGLTLGGADASNYSFNAGTSTTADITPRALTIGAVGINRIYNALLGASVTLNDDRVAGDVLTTGFTSANFATKDVDTGKTVTVTGLTLGGADAGNYSFNVGTTTTANITPRALTIGAVGIDKPFDGTTIASVTLNDNREAGDILSTGFGAANFVTILPGTGITITVTGLTLGGADAGNYSFNASTTTVADITGSAPPPPAPTVLSLPNTVVKVTQDPGDTVGAPADDGIYATPTGTYVLVYLPANAPVDNKLQNRAPVVRDVAPITTAFLTPDEEKRLRNARAKRARSLLAGRSKTFIFDANMPVPRQPGGFEASPSVKSI